MAAKEAVAPKAKMMSSAGALLGALGHVFWKTRPVLFSAIIILGSVSPSLEQETGQSLQIAPYGSPGVPADRFPLPNRPVAEIEPQYSTEEARERIGEAAQVMNFLGVRPGMTVADLGAGGGYYTVRLARRVGPNGLVYAEDVEHQFLQDVQRRVQERHFSNVRLVLGESHDPRLPPQSVDLALMAFMYHEVSDPYGLLFNLLPALRPGARVAVIELDIPTEFHGMPYKVLLCEFHSIGFRQTYWRLTGSRNEYVAVFEPPAQAPRVEDIEACSS